MQAALSDAQLEHHKTVRTLYKTIHRSGAQGHVSLNDAYFAMIGEVDVSSNRAQEAQDWNFIPRTKNFTIKTWGKNEEPICPTFTSIKSLIRDIVIQTPVEKETVYVSYPQRQIDMSEAIRGGRCRNTTLTSIDLAENTR